MSESSPNLLAPTAPLPASHEHWQAVADLAVAALSATKAALFDALRDAGITELIVEFDGADDSGQIESLTAYVGERVVALPAKAITIREPGPDATGLTDRACPLTEAIEAMAYDFLEQDHGGWEINDGAFGTFTFDTADRVIRLEYNARYTSYDYFEHAY